MADQPPDPSAHAQVHDWAEERGLKTVDLLHVGILCCPECGTPLNSMRGTKGTPDFDWQTYYHPAQYFSDPADACSRLDMEFRVRIEHLTLRYLCEVIQPAAKPSPADILELCQIAQEGARESQLQALEQYLWGPRD